MEIAAAKLSSAGDIEYRSPGAAAPVVGDVGALAFDAFVHRALDAIVAQVVARRVDARVGLFVASVFGA